MRFYTFIILFIACQLTKAQHKVVNDSPIKTFREKKQNQEQVLKYISNEMGLEFVVPSDYKKSPDLPSYFQCNSDFNIESDVEYIRNDGAVLISCSLNKSDSLEYIKVKKSMSVFRPDWKNYDLDSNWMYLFRTYADTVNSSWKIYSSPEIKKFNADNGIEFSITCDQLYLKKYKMVRSVIINKKYRGLVTLSYFVDPESGVDISDEIQKTKGIVAYKN